MIATTTESVLEYCRENNRVCPLPQYWNHLWKMLPEQVRVGAGWQPPAPLILAAWHESTDMMKMLRFAEHIQWADKYGFLEPVASFLYQLNERDWHHLGD